MDKGKKSMYLREKKRQRTGRAEEYGEE